MPSPPPAGLVYVPTHSHGVIDGDTTLGRVAVHVIPHSVSARVSTTFRRIVSGDPTGRPAWVRAIEQGDDAGLYGPGSAPWAVHGDLTTLVGGVRALLVQALHPAALAGVREHSRFEDHALDRLAGTTRWLVTLTFGDSAAVARESERVRRMHARVEGTYADTADTVRPYAADDPHLLRWVHAAFTDSFLTTHLVWGAPIPGGPDAYVAQWATAAELLGLPDPPRTRAELEAQLGDFEPELAGSPEARQVARFVLSPPLPAVGSSRVCRPGRGRRRNPAGGLPSSARPATRTAASHPHRRRRTAGWVAPRTR